MSQKREKRRRQRERALYAWRLHSWERSRPPKWRFISYYLWKKDKPKWEGK